MHPERCHHAVSHCGAGQWPCRGRRISANDSARLVETAARVQKARGVGADAAELALAVRPLVLAPRDELPGQAAGLIDPRRRPREVLVLGRTDAALREPDERGGCPAAVEEPSRPTQRPDPATSLRDVGREAKFAPAEWQGMEALPIGTEIGPPPTSAVGSHPSPKDYHRTNEGACPEHPGPDRP